MKTIKPKEIEQMPTRKIIKSKKTENLISKRIREMIKETTDANNILQFAKYIRDGVYKFEIEFDEFTEREDYIIYKINNGVYERAAQFYVQQDINADDNFLETRISEVFIFEEKIN